MYPRPKTTCGSRCYMTNPLQENSSDQPHLICFMEQVVEKFVRKSKEEVFQKENEVVVLSAFPFGSA